MNTVEQAKTLKHQVLLLQNKALVPKYRSRLEKLKKCYTPEDLDALYDRLADLEKHGECCPALKPGSDRFA